MEKRDISELKEKFTEGSFEKLQAINNPFVNELVAKFIMHCDPDSVFVRDDSSADAEYLKERSIELGEEKILAATGHTYHFDGVNDQARDKSMTKYLLSKGQSMGSSINSTERESGLKEVHGFLKDCMKRKQMYVCFFCLGPVDSVFSISALQITDSCYVTHSEHILYRDGYEQFKKMKKKDEFFKFVHTAGVLENCVSKDVDKRRIYIDLEEKIVYSTNTQYAGNTVGLKKLALRLAINKSSKEGWLAEHMFVMGVNGTGSRKTYFAGAFPSACGKTSTCMLEGETIMGDDIAYLRKVGNKIHAANVESGIFGIIKDVNPDDDPVIYETLTAPGEVIFSNVLIKDDVSPYWLGSGMQEPKSGINYAGKWSPGKSSPSHKNARYTIRLSDLKNKDENLENPDGVEISGFIYGGRDSDTSVPVEQSFDWAHGILTKAATIESETTAATLGQEGVRKFNLMANLDFVSMPLSEYIMNNVNFADGIKNPPAIFCVNYFLKNKDGTYMNGIKDKHAWLKWMELRVNGDVDAITTPTGHIPKYEDLKKIFQDVLNKEYTQDDYDMQFTIRIPENLAKIKRIREIYSKVPNAPKILLDTLSEQEKRLNEAKSKYGDYIKPAAIA